MGYIQKAEPFAKRLCYIKNIVFKRISEMLWHKLPPPFWVAEIQDFANSTMEGVDFMGVLYLVLNTQKRAKLVKINGIHKFLSKKVTFF